MKLFSTLAATSVAAMLCCVNSAIAKNCHAEFIKNHMYVELGMDKDGTPLWNGARVIKRSQLESYFAYYATQRNVYFHVTGQEKTDPRLKYLIADARRHGLRFSDCKILFPLIKAPPPMRNIVVP